MYPGKEKTYVQNSEQLSWSQEQIIFEKLAEVESGERGEMKYLVDYALNLDFYCKQWGAS